MTECAQPSCMSVICCYCNRMMLLAVVTNDSYIGRDIIIQYLPHTCMVGVTFSFLGMYTEGTVFNPAFLAKRLPPFSEWHLILWMTKFGGGRKCVDYVGKVSNTLANQTNRKVRGDRSWTKPVELKSFKWEKLAFGCLDKKVYRNWPAYLNANVYAFHWTSRRVCSWTWHTTINLPEQQTKPNIYAVSS
jgi:hypothetical protein